MSEVMLQQTTVGTVLGRYEDFLARFPDLKSLARAREDSVLAAWSGLGYYGRARRLHQAARQILALHGGKIPSDEESLRGLPGFGPYTAAAVAAIAFGRRALPMDANIRRVVSRLFCAIRAEEFLERVIGKTRVADAISALFDLGQGICRPRSPLCGACPVAARCCARRRNTVSQYPPKKALAPHRRFYVCAAVEARAGKYWLRRRRSTWLSGLWEFPAVEAASRRKARARFSRTYGKARFLGFVEHTVVRRKLHIDVYRVDRAAEPSGGRWMTIRQVRDSAAPTLTKKIAGLLSQP